MKIASLQQELQQNSYPGRGIVLGRSEDGNYAVSAYFIMGRSENSRNRVFVEDGAGIRTQAFDPSKMVDPSLIIYAPVRVLGDYTIVTNGDQTDTVYDLMQAGKTFEESLRTREFEPDAPNYTPRISGLIDQSNNGFSYALSILKSADGDPTSCQRYTFAYSNPIAGVGHFIHTYEGDGNPLPSFSGEPQKIAVSGVKYYIEVANMPTTNDALNFLRQQKHIIVAPSKAVNAGGVGVSALEMAQNSERLVWSAEEVDHQLHTMMENIHRVSAEAAAEYGLGYDLVAGANIAGFKKVAEAMMEQGCF